MSKEQWQLDSCELAEQYVREQMTVYIDLHESFKRGDKIDVEHLNQCDCVPVRIKMPDGRLWLLHSVSWEHSSFLAIDNSDRGLVATYVYTL